MTQKTHKAFDLTEDDMMGEVPQATSGAPVEPLEEPLLNFPDRAELEQKLTQLEQELSAATERELRVRADLDNIQRRHERRLQETHQYAISKLLEELIPVLDSLEQSLTVQDAAHDLVKSMREGMALTLQMLQKVLKKFGVQEIYPLHQAFDPRAHEVMVAQENAEYPANTVISVLQKGYQLHERIIRPARVIVAKAGAGG